MGLNYLCSENKGADQLCGYSAADLRLCFHIFKKQDLMTLHKFIQAKPPTKLPSVNQVNLSTLQFPSQIVISNLYLHILHIDKTK